jgi:hypothetical protein
VKVSPALVDRSIAIVDAIIKRWESRGGTVLVQESRDDNRSTRFVLGQDGLGVEISENVNNSKPLSDPDRLAGDLAIQITGDESQQFRRHWSDTKSQRFERMVNLFVDTLANALAVKQQARLDAECIARQKEKVKAIRDAAAKASSQQFYWRQEMMQAVGQWEDGRRIRRYLRALRAAIDRGDIHPANAPEFEPWFEWASAFADGIDPLKAAAVGRVVALAPKTTAVADLDVTARARAVLTKLGIADSDDLWKQSQDSIRSASEGRFGQTWNEFTRILEGLGYDVSKRENASECW